MSLINLTEMETPEQYFERLRKEGWTDDITSNPEPDYSQPFYQNIFRMMEGYARYCETNRDESHVHNDSDEVCCYCNERPVLKPDWAAMLRPVKLQRTLKRAETLE